MKATNFSRKRNHLVPVLLAGIIAVTGFATTALSASASTISEYDMSQEPSYRRLDTLNYETSTGSTSSSSSGLDMNYNMPSSDWSRIYGAAYGADVIVTKDFVTMGVDHGHAALMVSGTKTVEHYGSGNDDLPGANGKSGEYYFSNLWRHVKSCRVYRYDGITSDQKSDICEYARENLVGWDYSVAASRTNSSKMNCATLVWKAYNHAGITLNGYWKGFPSYTMLPSDFVLENPDLKMMASAGWSGGEHEWN